MTVATRCFDYDAYARIYNEYNGKDLSERAVPPLEKLLLPYLPKEAHILDLCCGTGQLANQLLMKGYQVTGIDNSKGMLNYARQNAPGGNFVLSDARSFELMPSFHGAISTSDSLNHMTNLEDLICVFRNVYAALLPDGLFVFDLNLEARYQSEQWNGSIAGDIQDEYAWAARRSYDAEAKMGRTEITLFQLVEETWQRFDTTLLAKSYLQSEVESALEHVGFTAVRLYDAKRDFGVHEWGDGKVYFVGCKPSA